MEKIMILGASILQLPAIIKAKEMGLQVIAVDQNKSAIGFNAADICLEISTIDTPNVVRAAKKYCVNGVMTLATDMPMQTVASVAKELNIIGVNEVTALQATNKGSMRECLLRYNVPIPAFYRAIDYSEYLAAVRNIRGKYVVKPADNSGSRGVFLVQDSGDKYTVDYAFEYSRKFSRSGEILVEEFMDGPEVSVETISTKGEVHIIAITDKETTGPPQFVEMGHSQPSRLGEKVTKQIEKVAIAAIKAIGIQNGPSHTEIIITDDGPKIVELGARLGGDNITTHLVPLSTGIDMVKCCIELALGYEPDIKTKFKMGSAIRYFKTPAGKIADITGVEEAKHCPGIKQISFVKSVGENVREINSSLDRIGFVIAQARNADEAIDSCRGAMSKIQITIE